MPSLFVRSGRRLGRHESWAFVLNGFPVFLWANHVLQYFLSVGSLKKTVNDRLI